MSMSMSMAAYSYHTVCPWKLRMLLLHGGTAVVAVVHDVHCDAVVSHGVIVSRTTFFSFCFPYYEESTLSLSISQDFTRTEELSVFGILSGRVKIFKDLCIM